MALFEKKKKPPGRGPYGPQFGDGPPTPANPAPPTAPPFKDEEEPPQFSPSGEGGFGEQIKEDVLKEVEKKTQKV